MRLLLTLLLFTITLISCDFTDDKLIIVNNSNDKVAFIIPAEPDYFPTTLDTNEISDKNLNDSLLNTYAKYELDKDSFGGIHFLESDSSKRIWTFNIYWEQIVESTPTNSLKVLFFADSIMTSGKYKWNEIYDQKLYVEHEYTLEELDEMNWRINYKR